MHREESVYPIYFHKRHYGNHFSYHISGQIIIAINGTSADKSDTIYFSAFSIILIVTVSNYGGCEIMGRKMRRLIWVKSE